MKAAGADIGVIAEAEYFRVRDGRARARRTSRPRCPRPDDTIDLTGQGAAEIIPPKSDFIARRAAQPAIVAQVQASQDAAGVPRGLPGGDPSTPLPAPREQWRSDYVFLTPDKYVFDFVVIVAPSDAHVYLDGLAPKDRLATCARRRPHAAERGAPTPPFWIYRCQLSFPVIDPTQKPPNNVPPGMQNNGVHRVHSDQPVGVIVYGFDSYVSYAYAGRDAAHGHQPAVTGGRPGASAGSRSAAGLSARRRASGTRDLGPDWRTTRAHSSTVRRRGPKGEASAASESMRSVGVSTP